jgi:F-type H+-transporting ATPase subunit gamma
VTGERGLCGAFNTNVLRKAAELFRQTGRNQVSVLPIGKKGRDALRKQGRALAGEYTNVLARVRYEDARRIATQVIDLYAKAEVDAVYVVFSEFKNVLTPHLVAEKILPVEAIREAEESSAEAEMAQVDYIYEQPAGVLLDRLLPRYVETQVYRIMLESSAAEHAARMAAMESATQNAGEVIERLTLHMNKVRQAAITREIIEVVSGAASAG